MEGIRKVAQTVREIRRARERLKEASSSKDFAYAE